MWGVLEPQKVAGRDDGQDRFLSGKSASDIRSRHRSRGPST